ncbi:MAG: type I-E CRISPR-associated protein Cas6/Cse3/CasE [Chloroflexia bacterium]|nr:type I-E CRISPR-associated protein Cas6/Cse3/CasE [Chloroflexia bacterium]
MMMTNHDAQQTRLLPDTSPRQAGPALDNVPARTAGDDDGEALWLSRLDLNPRSRMVQVHIRDAHALHQQLMQAFRSDGRNRAGQAVLHRLDADSRGRSPRLTLLVQSAQRPDWSILPNRYLLDDDGWFDGQSRDPIAIKTIEAQIDALEPGTRLRFRLRANPTRKIRSERNPKNGTRAPVMADNLERWLARKGIDHGFQVIDASWRFDPTTGKLQYGNKSTGSRMTHHAVLFEGSLVVTDTRELSAAVRHGIGPAKAYGFGLLSLAALNAAV